MSSINRRRFLATTAAAGLARAASPPSASRYHLRYAPRLDVLPELPMARKLEIFAEWGFPAFEYNPLPRHEMREIEALRKKREELGMAMGVFHLNSAGWKGDSLVDKKFHEPFLKDVSKAVEIWNVMENEAATVTTGVAVDYLSHDEQTRNCIEGLKRAAEIVDGTGMELVLEPINRRQTGADYFVVYSGHAVEIVSAVNHPQVRILFDIFHQQISEGDLIRHIREHWDWIGYFQVGDVPGRNEPYTGEINYQNVFKAIYDQGFDGIVGMEHGLSAPGLEGLEKCFEAYRRADAWDG